MQRILKAFQNSWAGLRAAFHDEVAFRQDLLMVFIGLCVLQFVDITIFEKILLGCSLFFILIAELINTAIENVVDRIGPEYHDLSKKAKDMGSAVVLLTILVVLVLWVDVLLF